MTAHIAVSTRTRAETGGPAVTTPEQLSTGRLLIVVVDLWTRHPCSGASARAERMIPALNRFLDAARALGIQVVFASSGDDLARWRDSPHRHGITRLPHHPLPPSNRFLDGHG